MQLNIADLFEHAVDAAPDNPAVKVGARTVTYAELESESNKLAHYLQSQGVEPGQHVAVYAKNSIEHVIAVLAIVKIRAVNINVNYRYVEGELNYLFDNADVVALIVERTYAPLVARTKPNHPKLQTVVVIPDVIEPDDQSDIAAFGGVLYAEALADQSAERDFAERSPDDLHIIYTGGTTGMPKGVMWRHEDFWRVLGGGIDFYTGDLLDEYAQSKQANDPRMVTFPLSPLMHGGLFLVPAQHHQAAVAEPVAAPHRLGQRADLAAAYKLFGNMMIMFIVGGTADIFALARGIGIDPADAITLFSDFNPAGQITARGKRMAAGEFTPAAFELSAARKDIRLMLDSAREAGATLHMLPAIAKRFDEIIAAGHGSDDLAAAGADIP